MDIAAVFAGVGAGLVVKAVDLASDMARRRADRRTHDHVSLESRLRRIDGELVDVKEELAGVARQRELAEVKEDLAGVEGVVQFIASQVGWKHLPDHPARQPWRR